MQEESQELKKVLKDIQFVRSAIEQNGEYLRRVVYTPSYRVVFWLSGLGSAVFSLIFYFFIKTYQSFDLIPPGTKMMLVILSSFVMLLAGIIKMSTIGFMRQHYPGQPVTSLIVKMMGRSMLLTYILVGFLMGFFSIYFGMIGLPRMIFPVIAISTGMLFATLGSLFSFHEITFCGLVMLIPGAVSVPFIMQNPLSLWLWMAGTFGCSMLATAVWIEIKVRMNRVSKE